MSEFKAGKKIEIRTLDDARPFVGMRARLRFRGDLRGEGPISIGARCVMIRPGGYCGAHDSGAVVPEPGATLTLLGTEAENLRVMLDASNKAAAELTARLVEAEVRETLEAEERARAEALAEESARFPLPSEYCWGRTDFDGHVCAVNDNGCIYVDDGGDLMLEHEHGGDLDEYAVGCRLDVVRAVIARYDAENPPKVEKPAGYDLDVAGVTSREIVNRFPEILDGDVVMLTLTDGRTFIRELEIGSRIHTAVIYLDILYDHSTLVSGGRGFGVSKITFLRRDAAATAPKVEGYDIDVAGRYGSALGHNHPEILDGDIVTLTLHDGSRVTRIIELHPHCGPFANTPFSIEDGDVSKIVSGVPGYGVQRITLVRRAEEPYSVQLDGLAMDDVDHEFEEGDRVLLTHEDGRETEHTILTLFPGGDCGVQPHCGHEWTQDVVNCSYKGVVKITRLEASA